MSLPLFVLAGLVGLAAGLYALQSQAERLKIYLMLLLAMQGGLMGVFASVDVLYLYFFHEVALIPTFILTLFWGGEGRRSAAMQMAIYLTVGAMLSLAGASYQGVFRNPLVDPYLLGAAAGAGLGATVAIAFLRSVRVSWPVDPIVALGFVGAMLVFILFAALIWRVDFR